MSKTECFHCGETFDGGVPIVGKPTARMEGLLHKLGFHLNRKHPELAQQLQQEGAIVAAMLMGMRCMDNFKSDDEELNAERDKHRWQVHQQTLAHRVIDETLKEQVRDLSALMLAKIIDLDYNGSWWDGKAATHPDYNGSRGDLLRASLEVLMFDKWRELRDALEEPNKYEVPKVGQLVSLIR